MKIEIWLGRIEGDSTFALEFNDGGMPTQYSIMMIKRDREGKIVERTEIGIVNKSDITRIAKAS